MWQNDIESTTENGFKFNAPVRIAKKKIIEMLKS